MIKTSGFFKKLKKRWGIQDNKHVIIVLLVFSLTGFSTLFAEELIVHWLNMPGKHSWGYRILFFVFLSLPIYNILLLVWGFMFGQFWFFLNFEKKFFGSIGKGIVILFRKLFRIR